MSTLGIIGCGNIGTAIARLAVAAEIDVVIANSRGPQSLTSLVGELGPRAAGGTVPAERMLQAPAPPLSADKLRAALEAAQRVKVAERPF